MATDQPVVDPQRSETLTREALIALCHTAVVPQERWHDRDSSSAQKQIGEACALLGAGCRFRVRFPAPGTGANACVTNDKTIWIDITSHGFDWFESGDSDDTDTYYIPTPERLARAAGRDWY